MPPTGDLQLSSVSTRQYMAHAILSFTRISSKTAGLYGKLLDSPGSLNEAPGVRRCFDNRMVEILFSFYEGESNYWDAFHLTLSSAPLITCRSLQKQISLHYLASLWIRSLIPPQLLPPIAYSRQTIRLPTKCLHSCHNHFPVPSWHVFPSYLEYGCTVTP